MSNISVHGNLSASGYSQEIFCSHNETHATAQVLIRVFMLQPLILFGLVANLLNALVFTRKGLRRQHVNWFLTALTLADACLLMSTFAMLILPILAEVCGYLPIYTLSAIMTRFVYPIGLFSQTCSVYLTVAVSVHRFLGVCYPFQMRQWDNGRNIRIAIVAVVMWSVVFNLPKWFVAYEVYLEKCASEIFTLEYSLVALPSKLVMDHIYGILYTVAAYMLIMFTVPFMILIAVNWRIIKAVKHSKKLAGSSNNGNADNPKIGEKKTRCESSTTTMLLAVVALFLMCNIPAFIVNVLDVLLRNQFLPHTFYPTFIILVEMSNVLVNLNSSSNIFVYFLFGTKFRSVFKEVMKCPTAFRFAGGNSSNTFTKHYIFTRQRSFSTIAGNFSDNHNRNNQNRTVPLNRRRSLAVATAQLQQMADNKHQLVTMHHHRSLSALQRPPPIRSSVIQEQDESDDEEIMV